MSLVFHEIYNWSHRNGLITFVAFETGWDSVYGVKEHICEPAKKSWGEGSDARLEVFISHYHN